MNDNRLPNDDLLLFVCDEVDDARRVTMQKAITEDPELAAAARGLETALAAVRAESIGPVSSEFNDRLRQRTQKALDRPTFLTRSLSCGRWIMRSPVSRIAATVLFVLMIAGVGLWFHDGDANFALADFIQPIIEAKSVKYQMTLEMEGMPTTTCDMTVLAPARYRQEKTILNTPTVQIVDHEKGKMLVLYPNDKRASISDIPCNKNPANWVADMRSPLLAARDNPDVKHEPLGEKEIDGRRVIGYRLIGLEMPGSVLDIWGDPKTGLPIRIEIAMGGAKATMSDLSFNADVDESLMSVEPPAGYTVDDPRKSDEMPDMNNNLTEQDLIDGLRQYAEFRDGVFPRSLDLTMLFDISRGTLWANAGVPKGQKPDLQQQREILARVAKLQRGMKFAMQLRSNADAHYAGKGVSPDAADTPIFWYRPKDAKNYRVIYADLSVRDADTPPEVPNAQPVWAQPEPPRPYAEK